MTTPQQGSTYEVGAMVDALQTRRAQLKMRVGLSFCIVTIFFMVVGVGFSLVWGGLYLLAQAVEVWTFPTHQLATRLSKPEWRWRAVLVVLVSNVIFSSYVTVEAFHDKVGLDCAMFLTAGIIFNSILTSTRCPPLMWAGIGPALANLLVVPVAYYVREKSVLDTFFLSATIVFYVLAMLQGWTLIRALLKTERLAREAAEQANAAKTRFVANTSHELRTPLNAVVASASLLARLDLSPRGRELVGLLINGSNTLHALISDILDASKAAAGQLELDNQPFDPVAAVSATVEMFRAVAEAKGVALTFEAEGEKGWLLGDSLRLGQVVTNLCNNAVKFTASGSICVRLDLAAADDGRMGLGVRVTDTGIGMDAATAARIFDPFVQADVSTTRNFGGTGLGLSIAKALAEQMGGTLRVESQISLGSTFRLDVRLPKTEAPAEQAALLEGFEIGANTGARLKILVADDSRSNRSLIGFILEDIGDLVLVENGQEALDAIAGDEFDLFICDVQMPVMDGPAALARLRQWEQAESRPRLPAIIATADAAMSLAQAQVLGADGVVTKPFTAQSLLEAVSIVCEAIYEDAA